MLLYILPHPDACTLSPRRWTRAVHHHSRQCARTVRQACPAPRVQPSRPSRESASDRLEARRSNRHAYWGITRYFLNLFNEA